VIASHSNAIDAVPTSAWTVLASKRIYFGHQSVGDNILEGVATIVRQNPGMGMTLREGGDLRALEQPAIVHSKIGANCHPLTKIQAFANLMRAGAGERADAAMFKLCYVDIEDNHDPREVFRQYTDELDALAQRFPRVRFLHCTAPLTVIPGGLKNAIKKALGRSIWGYEHNRKRGVFNALMREKYAATGGLFDIASLESTRPDGTKETFALDSGVHEAMYPPYTHDGGHLGPLGRDVLARAFLGFLARATQ
jgi:hypothetical protein